MDPILAATILELSKVLLTGFFSLARTANKTDEEIDALYQKAKADFFKNDPTSLPDVD